MLTPTDLDKSASCCQQALSAVMSEDWGRPAGELSWSCRQTLDHVIDAHFLYAVMFASRASAPVPSPRRGNERRSVLELIALLPKTAAMLRVVLQDGKITDRAYHASGMADASGFAAMGCNETLIHTADILQGFGYPFEPPDDLAERVLGRLFPWVSNADPWPHLLWANGRRSLPDKPRLDPSEWAWRSEPLSEWDGTVARRSPANPSH